MGTVNDKSKQFLEAEFLRLSKNRQYLVLSELLQFRPQSMLPVDLSHLGVLWVLDNDNDGRVTLQELNSLADMCRERSTYYQNFECSAQIQGFCCLQLWQSMCSPGGQEQFTDWICTLLLENSPNRRRFWRYGHQQYLNIDTIEALHQLLRVQELHGTDFQTFFDLLQRVGEDKKLMDLGDEEQDEWVPLLVVKELANGAYLGMAKLMSDICAPL